ncbi:DNA polymerase III subunit gamma/tau [soil metagenome]
MDTGPGRTQSLYRKYRPETFERGELVGQDHVRDTLRNAISNGRVSHAYLFCGPRGTGKTTTARLLAKAVNCLDPDPAKRPCNVCEACVAINQGRATDIIEIDAASNRGIEDIRDLREQVKYAPTQLRHKFYIIDEAHRLTRDAFNAFLKTLEEPPPNTTFVLATTDPDELLETVASRCQRFDFHRIPADQIAMRVRTVCEAEGIEIDEDALEIVIRQSTGSLRDALSLIDMLATATSDREQRTIDADMTRKMLGLSQDERTLTLIQAIRDRDLALGLQTINDALDSGQDMRSFGRQIQAALRLLMLCRAGASPAEADDGLRELAARFELPDLLRINREFSEIDFAIRNGGFPQLPIELAFVSSVVHDGPVPVESGSPVETARTAPPQSRSSSPRPAPDDSRPANSTRQPEHREPIPFRRGAEVRSAEASPPSTNVEQPPDSAPEPESPEVEPAGSLTVDLVVEHWQEVRTEVKAADRKVEALLASCDPYSILDGTLYLSAAYPFHANKLNEDRNRVTIEEAVRRVTGHRVSVSTGLRDELPAVPVNPASEAPEPERPSAPRQLRDADPAAEEDEEPYQAGSSNDDTNEQAPDDEERQIVERMKAMFNGEEVDLDDLPVDLNPSS